MTPYNYVRYVFVFFYSYHVYHYMIIDKYQSITSNYNIFFSIFCSGGYNIKTGAGCLIELMKFDMGGSAAVLGAAKALGQIKPAGVEVRLC